MFKLYGCREPTFMEYVYYKREYVKSAFLADKSTKVGAGGFSTQLKVLFKNAPFTSHMYAGD